MPYGKKYIHNETENYRVNMGITETIISFPPGKENVLHDVPIGLTDHFTNIKSKYLSREKDYIKQSTWAAASS